jgi:hypothetical protein
VEVQSFAAAATSPLDPDVLSNVAVATEIVVVAADVLEDGATRVALEVEADWADRAAAIGEAFLARVLHQLEPARAEDDLAAVRLLLVMPALDISEFSRSELLLARFS